MYTYLKGFPHSSVSKESACNAGNPSLILGSGRHSGEENGNPLQFLSGEPHGQRSLAGYRPRDCKGWTQLSDKTTTTIHICAYTHIYLF